MAKINLYSHDWCDVVFLDKNKEYGAYDLRKQSGKRHLIAFVLVLAVIILALVLPTIIESVMPARTEHMTEVTTLADIKMEAPEEKQEQIHDDTPPPPPLKSTIKFTIPVIKEDEKVNEEDEVKTQEQLDESGLTISTQDMQGTDEENGLDIAELEKHEEIVETPSSEDAPYSFVEQKPEFPGGEAAFRTYLGENVKYPSIAAENGVKGTVYVEFVVSPDGKLSRVKVVRGFDKSCEDEAVRVIKLMPSWKPGKQNGKAVYVRFTVPIKFDLR
ncbi:MAG: TonB family protein [Bacteroidales bacterium]|jgi:protein TonB|nr:TonB family protein [Bacteroidales bacterium]